MYRDGDGTATEQSQAQYGARVRLLFLATRLLSFVGFGAAILNGKYARENLKLHVSLDMATLLEYSKLCWVGSSFPRTQVREILLTSCIASAVYPQSLPSFGRQHSQNLHKWATRLNDSYIHCDIRFYGGIE
jgi:hypothetical protein